MVGPARPSVYVAGGRILQCLVLGRQRGDYSIFCVLVFAACALMTGVDSLIERPRDQWMLFWFPLALILSYQSGAPTLQPRTARPMTEQPNN
jgi:hypothetical protein